MSLFLLGVTIVLLPVLVPQGPANSAPGDVFAVAFILVALASLVVRRRAVAVPAAAAIGLILVGSLLALTRGTDLPTGLRTLLVDGYLLLLLVMVVNRLRDDERALRLVLVIWAVSALVWATVLVGAHFHALPRSLVTLLQVRGNAKRQAGPTGNNPNLAASYMVISFFVLLASSWPRARMARVLAAGWLVLGLYATGSLGGLAGLAAGGSFLALAGYLRAGRTPFGVQARVGALVLGLVAVAVLVLSTVGVPRPTVSAAATLSAQAKGRGLGDSVGRLDKSLNGRIGLWSSALAKTGSRAVLGIGPGEAKDELSISNGNGVHSLHNDFLAYLVERGVIGLVGLLVLYVALVKRAVRLAAGDAARRITLQALGAAVVANIVDSFVHETLHFRHAIVLFALLWAASDLAASGSTVRVRLPMGHREVLDVAR